MNEENVGHGLVQQENVYHGFVEPVSVHQPNTEQHNDYVEELAVYLFCEKMITRALKD